MRWTNVIGEVHEGKLACAKGVDSLLEAAQEYQAEPPQGWDSGELPEALRQVSVVCVKRGHECPIDLISGAT